MKLNNLQELKNKIEECQNKPAITKRTLTFFDVPPTIMYWQEKNK